VSQKLHNQGRGSEAVNGYDSLPYLHHLHIVTKLFLCVPGLCGSFIS